MSKNSRPRGFGFVTYDKPLSAAKALVEPQRLDGRLVDVKRAVPGEKVQERTSNKIFVGGLPQDVTTEELRAYFSSYGAVADAVVMVDRRTNRSRGFGFIRFHNGPQGCAAAEVALGDFSIHQLGGRWVEVKPAAPAALLQEFANSGSEDGLGENDGCDWLAMAMALADPADGMYLADQSAWEDYCLSTFGGDMASMMDATSAAAPRVRGRRGRRRNKRAVSGFSGSEWSHSFCSEMELGADYGADFGADRHSSHGSGEEEAAQCDGMLAGFGDLPYGLPPSAAAAAAAWHSAAAAACFGGGEGCDGLLDCPPGLEGLVASSDPILPEQRRMSSKTSDGGQSRAVGKSVTGSTRSPAGSVGSDVSENDPSRANTATPRRARGPSDFLTSPMKVNYRAEDLRSMGNSFQLGLPGLCLPLDREGNGMQAGQWCNNDMREGVTREEFLSLEVRPWLAAW